MLFLTKEESMHYVKMFQPPELLIAEDDPLPERELLHCSFGFEEEIGYRYFGLSRLAVDWLTPFSSAVLLVSEYGIWPSSENRHLFHRYRLSYSENRPIFLAPGHFFQSFEESDLITTLHLCLLFGWGGILITNDQKTVCFSHDGWIGFFGEGCSDILDKWQ